MSDEMTIRTNNVPRQILSWSDLTAKEKAEFNYFNEEDEGMFVRYRNWTYDLSEFTRTPISSLESWDGYLSDSFFSGIVVKFVNDGEAVIMGTYYY